MSRRCPEFLIAWLGQPIVAVRTSVPAPKLVGHIGMVLVLIFIAAACGTADVMYGTVASCEFGDCEPGSLCVEGRCAFLCTLDFQCPDGEQCTAAGFCFSDSSLTSPPHADSPEDEILPPQGTGTSPVSPECFDGASGAVEGCGTPSDSVATCGDGVLDAGEACDDGNAVDGDGCTGGCEIELCGNGRLDVEEGCDDFNTFAGDGCSPDCAIEPNSVCEGAPSSCTVDDTVDPFTLADLNAVEPGAKVTSDDVTLTGFIGTLTAAVAFDPSAILVVNGEQTQSGVVVWPGDSLAVATIASTQYETNVSAVVTVGNYVTVWTVTTRQDIASGTLIAEHSWSGTTGSCDWWGPPKDFTVPADGEYELESFGSAPDNYYNWTPNSYVFEGSTQIENHTVHNGLCCAEATFRYTTTYTVHTTSRLRRGVTYTFKQHSGVRGCYNNQVANVTLFRQRIRYVGP